MARRGALRSEMTPEELEKRREQNRAYNHRVKMRDPERYAQWCRKACEASTTEKRKRMYEKHRDKRVAESAEYRDKNRELVRQQSKDYAAKKRSEDETAFLEAKRESVRKWRESEKGRLWHQKNADKKREQTRARQARLQNAMPAWVDRHALQEMFTRAREMTEVTGVPHEVDHIIPLKGNGVSGLHVPWNLQVITRFENRSKGNHLKESYHG